MEKSLVIVESPAKAKTITKFLGKDFKVLACKGHVRALPSKQGSVDIGEDVVPKYDILPDSKKYLSEISKSLKGCSTVYLATDPDREGEAIAWHLVSALKLPDGQASGATTCVKRIVFHEITKDAINEAVKTPRDIAHDLVDAQQARVVLDYLVGFNLSPFLWKKVRYGLSAGRVQSVALRLICDRELEIRAFKQDEYWTIEAQLTPQDAKAPFGAQLVQIEGKKLDKLAIGTGDEAQKIVADLAGAAYAVGAVQKKEIRRTPPPPFITSTLQQDASRKLGFSARKTMSVAQKLYEGIDVGGGTTGLITYMRTDSVNLSETALHDLHDTIVKLYGPEYGLKQPRKFAQKSKNAQEAHEAIRPTDARLIPDEIKHALSADEYKLYSLIWKRAMASQMAVALLDSVSVDIDAKSRFTFRATGSSIRFPGFMKLYIESDDSDDDKKDEEKMLPRLAQGQALDLLELAPEQHFTQPPPRYTEASLVKALEELGIGRPSTYASIIAVLQEREYVKLIKKRFHPEDTGMIVSDLLVNHFSKYVDYGFTSYMEDRLDQIARGEASWKPAIKEFWKPFIALIKDKETEVKKSDVTTEKTEESCPECGKQLLIRLGKYGRFYACSGFPDCRYVRNLKNSAGEDGGAEAAPPTDETCDQCGKPLVVKQGRYGAFYGCSGYPACRFIRPLKKPVTLDVACPDCGAGKVTEKRSRRGKIFYSCSTYPRCKFASWDKPVAQSCPDCGHAYLVEKVSKRTGRQIKCPAENCKYKRKVDEPAAEE